MARLNGRFCVLALIAAAAIVAYFAISGFVITQTKPGFTEKIPVPTSKPIITEKLPLPTKKSSVSCPDQVLQEDKSVDLNLQDLLHIENYVHPLCPTIVGRKFGLTKQASETAKELISELATSYTRRPIRMDTMQSLPKLVPVSGISNNHFIELSAHLGLVEKAFPNTTILVYDLGLDQDQIDKLRAMPSVEYRKLNFSRFPEHVRDLHTYAFKILVIQDALAEFGGVMWFDASIVLKSREKYLQRMVKHKSGFLHYSGITGHSNVFATYHTTFEYLPMKGVEEMNGMMETATGMILFNTANVLINVMRWAIVCSLQKNCIAPPGGTVCCCNFSVPKGTYGGCHRFDQSVFSILVSNAYNYKTERFALVGDELKKIRSEIKGLQ